MTQLFLLYTVHCANSNVIYSSHSARFCVIGSVSRDAADHRQVDPKAPDDKNFSLFEEFQQLLKRERICKDEVNGSQLEVQMLDKCIRVLTA